MFQTFRSLGPFLKKHRFSYAAGLICLVLTNSGQILMPQWLKQAVDHIAGGHPQLGIVSGIVFAMALTALGIAATRISWRYFLFGSARKIEFSLRQKLMDHLLDLPPSFYARHKTGDLMARATNDLDAVRMSVGMAFVAFVDALFISVTIIIILFIQNPGLALVIIAPLPVITVMILAFGGLVGRRFKKVQEEYSRLSQFVQEHLSGNRVTKAFVLEGATDQRFNQVNRDYREANMSLVKLWGFFFPLISALSGLSALLLLFFGGQAVMKGTMSPGEFTATLSYLSMLIWPLMGAGMVVNMLQRGAASLKRINEILLTEPEIRNPDQGAVTQVPHYGISLRNLNFRYPDQESPALDGLNLEIPEGTFLGILGRLGSGKSTLTNLLPRLLDPPEGTVFLGGQDIRNYDLGTLRRCFSMVPQTTFLFSDSIKGNLAFAAPEADEAFLRRMAELSTISRDIDNFDKGWETLVGERGVTLSGGQKQRLSLSRALAAQSPILILDDALSAVDLETEEKIIGHFRRERAGMTNILVSHRVSTLRHCDRIIVLDAGRIVQEGTHAELMDREGIYQETARLQHVEEDR